VDPSTLLQRLIHMGALSTAQARWVEQQVPGGTAEDVQRVLLRYGLVATADLEVPSTQSLDEIGAAQHRCDRMMRAIFELCIQRGIIDWGEYLERLAATEDADGLG